MVNLFGLMIVARTRVPTRDQTVANSYTSSGPLQMKRGERKVVRGNCLRPRLAITCPNRKLSMNQNVTSVCIVMPAYNEQERIKKTLETYGAYFSKVTSARVTILVVVNGTTDRTVEVIQRVQKRYPFICYVDIPQAGKGLAIKTGFEVAVASSHPRYDLIGFVDADMATRPEHYHELIQKIGDADGIIASRYMPGALVDPPRPRIRRWGGALVFRPLVRALFGLSYYDTQCGAKLFKRKLIAKVTPHLTAKQWAFDVELLYLSKKFGFNVIEVPTVWTEMSGSKLKLTTAGTRMIGSLFSIWKHHRSTKTS